MPTKLQTRQLNIADGWIPVTDSWSYASETTITVPSGAASLYEKGDRLKLTQTTVKYFYIIAVSDTLLTITGGNDYTLANATITNIYYSHVDRPVEFPAYFNYTPIISNGGASTNPTYTVNNHYFHIIGKLCFCFINFGNTTGGTAGSGTNELHVSLPVALGISMQNICGYGDTYESGGTMRGVWARNLGVTNPSEVFMHTYDYNNILANDQSSAARAIHLNLTYVI